MAHTVKDKTTGPYRNLSLREKLKFYTDNDPDGQKLGAKANKWQLDQQGSDMHKRERFLKTIRDHAPAIAAYCKQMGIDPRTPDGMVEFRKLLAQ